MQCVRNEHQHWLHVQACEWAAGLRDEQKGSFDRTDRWPWSLWSGKNIGRLVHAIHAPQVTLKAHGCHHKSCSTIKANILEQARQKVWEYYELSDTDAIGKDGVLNLGVSYDGSWAKRGHTSKIGAGAIIDIMITPSPAMYCKVYINARAHNQGLTEHQI